MKKIILSLAVIAIVGAITVQATRAYFSDTETSSGNTFTAGAIDLQVRSECSYNGDAGNPGTCGKWEYPADGQGVTLGKFFDFGDVKPGDWGENTISFKVVNNDAWMCANVTSTNSENGVNEPELALSDTDAVGELGDFLTVFWWVDTDGDNVYEPNTPDNETILYQGPRTLNQWLVLGNGHLPLTFADSHLNWITGPGTPNTTPITGNEEQHLGVAWCVGAITFPNATGFSCDGSNVTNVSQTDIVMADLTFTAEQQRNNAEFVCPEHQP